MADDHRFVQGGKMSTDAKVENLARNSPRIRVRFDSRQFFELLIKYPKTLPYVQSARNVRLALGNTIYEIYE